MSIDYNKHFSETIKYFLKDKFQVNIDHFEFQATRKEFDGDITLLVFPLLSLIKINPEKLAGIIGEHLILRKEVVEGYNVVKGFLNK